MAKLGKTPASDEAWEARDLGADERFAKLAEDNVESRIDDALELQLISIRLQKSLIEDLKAIASLNAIGYQPLMRQVLKRFADSEKRRILRERAEQARPSGQQEKGAAAASRKGESRQRKAA